MNKRHRQQKFRFSLAFMIRMAIFIVLVYFAVNYFSANSSQINLPVPNVLGVTYNLLPSDSQEKINNINSNPAIIYLQTKLEQIKTVSADFPQKQITEIKKMVIQNVYENIMKSIENPAK